MLRLLTMAFAIAVAVGAGTIIIGATKSASESFRANSHLVSDPTR